MTTTRQARTTATVRTGWLGWVYFGGIMMMLAGLFQSIAGLVAIFNAAFYLVADSGLVVPVDYTVWGVLHLVLGVVAIGAGLAVIAGRTWGRTVGIILVALSVVANMAFITAYPEWAALTIALDFIVLYALVVHGHEAA